MSSQPTAEPDATRPASGTAPVPGQTAKPEPRRGVRAGASTQSTQGGPTVASPPESPVAVSIPAATPPQRAASSTTARISSSPAAPVQLLMRIDPVPVPRPEQPIRYGALLALFVTVIIVATFGLWVIIVAALHRFSDGLPYQLRDFIGSIILGIILGVAVAAYLHWTDRRRRWKKANADYYHNRVVQLQQSKLTAPGGSVSIQSATPHPPTRPGRSGTIGIGGIGVESPK